MMMMINMMIIILCFLLSRVQCDVNTMTDKILKDILKDYNADSRPAGKVSDRYSSFPFYFLEDKNLFNNSLACKDN